MSDLNTLIELIPVITAVAGTALLAYTDYKTTYMPDKYTHSMLLIGLAWLVLFNPNKAHGLVIAVVTFAVLFLMYLFGQIGGGDVKLFTALALLLPSYPKVLIPFIESIGINPVSSSPIPFIFNVFLLAGLIGPMFFISAWYFYKLYKVRKKVEDYEKKLFKAVAMALLSLPFIHYFCLFSPGFAFIFIPIITSLLILPFKNDVLKHFSMKKKRIKDLDDDDVLALEFISEAKKKKLGLWRKTFTSPELKKIKAKARKLGIKEIKVYDYLPQFGPFILISLIINLVIGNFIIYLMMAGV